MLNSNYVPKLSATVCGVCNSFHICVQRNTVLYFLEVENISKENVKISHVSFYLILVCTLKLTHLSKCMNCSNRKKKPKTFNIK